MKTLESYQRTALEAEILQFLCANPSSYESAELSLKHFANKTNRDVFGGITELKLEGREIVMTSLMDKIPQGELRYFFGSEYQIFTSKDFLEACDRLKEDWARYELLKKMDYSKSVSEFLSFADTVRRESSLISVVPIEKQLNEYKKNYEEIQKARESGNFIGLDFGWSKFQETVTIGPNGLVIVGAGPSIGKSTFALNMAIEASGNGHRVLFISIEMPAQQIFDKIFARLTHLNSRKYTLAYADLRYAEEEFEAIKQNFNFVYSPNCTTSTIRQLIRKSGKVDMVVVDYLQLLSDLPLKGEMRSSHVGRITKELRAIGGEYGVPMVVPCQINREGQKLMKPSLSSLRESGDIENTADIALLLHREDKSSKNLEVIVGKNRLGKADISLYFEMNPETSHIKESNKPKEIVQSPFNL